MYRYIKNMEDRQGCIRSDGTGWSDTSTRCFDLPGRSFRILQHRMCVSSPCLGARRPPPLSRSCSSSLLSVCIGHIMCTEHSFYTYSQTAWPRPEICRGRGGGGLKPAPQREPSGLNKENNDVTDNQEKPTSAGVQRWPPSLFFSLFFFVLVSAGSSWS